MRKKQVNELPDDTIIDVTLYKTMTKKEAEEMRLKIQKKGWVMKTGKEGYLKQGNKID